MAQFHCEICGEVFKSKSDYEQHMQASHPLLESSSEEIQALLANLGFPTAKRDLMEYVNNTGKGHLLQVFDQLPEQDYDDATHLARELSEIRRIQTQPDHQPSQAEGTNVEQPLSTDSIAQLFEAMEFPATREQLKSHARDADEAEMAIIDNFRPGTYQNLADVKKETDRHFQSVEAG